MFSSFLMSNVSAEIIHVTGEGSILMADIETQSQARERALATAMRNALNTAGVRIYSLQKSSDNMITEDEIRFLTVGIIHQNGEPEFDYENDKAFNSKIPVTLIHCRVQTFVDSDEIEKLIHDEKTDERIRNGKTYIENGNRIDTEYENAIKNYVTTEDESERRKIAEEIRKNNDEFTANEYFGRGNKLYDEKKYTEAIDEFSKAIQLDPHYKQAYTNRGVAYHDLKKDDEAFRDYNKAIQFDPNNKQAYYNRGNAYDDLGKYDDAIRDYNYAILLDPNNKQAYYNRGLAYYDLGKYDEAIRDYNKAILLDPKYALAYNNRGYTYYLLGKYDDAIRDLNYAIQFDPKYVKAYFNRGLAYCYLERYEEAIRDYNIIIQLDPNSKEAYYNRGFVYYYLGKYDLALADFQKALELDPNNQSVKNKIEILQNLMQQ